MRLIDAEHLTKWILSWWEQTSPTSEYLKGADILAQIDREPAIDAVSVEWIPCEKRLPEETMLCLVTIKEQVTPIIDWWVADEPTTPDPAPGKWKDNKLTHIAWMPLMEPYEERRNNG